MMGDFRLCEGVCAEGTQKLESSFSLKENGVEGLVSAQLIKPLAELAIGLFSEPLFFFLELPRSEDEGYDVYYLDNCTAPVARAIMERYAALLVNDGPSRFGFGSHKTQSEIYFTDYQEFELYTPDTGAAVKALEKLGLTKKAKHDSIWELLSEDNEGSLSTVEAEGDTVYDIPHQLSAEGMYKAE